MAEISYNKDFVDKTSVLQRIVLQRTVSDVNQVRILELTVIAAAVDKFEVVWDRSHESPSLGCRIDDGASLYLCPFERTTIYSH